MVLGIVERFAVELDASGVRWVEAGEQAQERRLARSRRSEHGSKAARWHAQRDVAQDGRGAVGLADAGHGEGAHVLVSESASNQRTSRYVGIAEIATINAA